MAAWQSAPRTRTFDVAHAPSTPGLPPTTASCSLVAGVPARNTEGAAARTGLRTSEGSLNGS